MPGLDPRRADLVGRRRGAARHDRCGGSAPTRSRSATCRCAKGSCSTTSQRHRKQIAQADRYPDVRRRSVDRAGRALQLLARARAAGRAAGAGALRPDAQRPRRSTDREREWLEYAALLHDIGVHISYERHHKHSYYLIKNGDLRGFEPDEIEIIALVARYHRQATPKRAPRRTSATFGRKRAADRAGAGGDPAARREPRPQPRADRRRRRAARPRRRLRCCRLRTRGRRRAGAVGGARGTPAPLRAS